MLVGVGCVLCGIVSWCRCLKCVCLWLFWLVLLIRISFLKYVFFNVGVLRLSRLR